MSLRKKLLYSQPFYNLLKTTKTSHSIVFQEKKGEQMPPPPGYAPGLCIQNFECCWKELFTARKGRIILRFWSKEILPVPVWLKIHLDHWSQATLESLEWSEAYLRTSFSKDSTLVIGVVHVQVQPSVQKHHSSWQCQCAKSSATEGHSSNHWLTTWAHAPSGSSQLFTNHCRSDQGSHATWSWLVHCSSVCATGMTTQGCHWKAILWAMWRINSSRWLLALGNLCGGAKDLPRWCANSNAWRTSRRYSHERTLQNVCLVAR